LLIDSMSGACSARARRRGGRGRSSLDLPARLLGVIWRRPAPAQQAANVLDANPYRWKGAEAAEAFANDDDLDVGRRREIEAIVAPDADDEAGA